MNCSKCGESLPDGKLFCPKCGFLNEAALGEEETRQPTGFRLSSITGTRSPEDVKAILLFALPLLLLSLLELYRLLLTLFFLQNVTMDLDYWRRTARDDGVNWLLTKQAIVYLIAILSLVLSVKTLRKKTIKPLHQKAVLVVIPLFYFSLFIEMLVGWISFVSTNHGLQSADGTTRTIPLSQLLESSLIGWFETFQWYSNMPELLVTIIFSGLAVYWFREHKQSQTKRK